MKKVMTFLGAFLVASILLASCGGGGGDADNKKQSGTEAPAENNSENSDNGSLEDNGTTSDDNGSTSDDNGSTSDDNSTSNTAGDCEQFCLDYEAFANDYVSIMKKYKANPTDPSILQDYSEMATKASDMQSSASNCTADPAVAARIKKALEKIAKAAM
ncbi:MAG: hypothetical protein FJZ66_08940 [Bacteroidetes bacterium]|nr:hypothetical protein [Bacteroidota bacterium]